MRRSVIVAFAFLLFSSEQTKGLPIDGLFNTGVNDARAILPAGSLEIHYVMTGPVSPAIVATPHFTWVAASAGAAWIGPTSGAVSDPLGTYVYKISFDLTGLDPATASIRGQWAADNGALIVLNGVGTGIQKNDQTQLTPFVISSGFVSGNNTLEFQVTNVSGAGGNPTGLLVAELSGTAEPLGPLLEGILDAASFRDGAVAPGQIVSLFGIGLAGETVVATEEPLPVHLGGTEVIIVDNSGVELSAPLFFVSSGQVNMYIPAEVALGPATIRLSRPNLSDTTLSVEIEAIAPGLFSANASGEGVAAALSLRVSDDGSRSTQQVFRFEAIQQRFVPLPIDLDGPGSDQVYLLLFGTGIRSFTSLPTVIVGGEVVPVIGAQPQGEFIGLDQVNVGPLPRALMGRGEVEILMFVDGNQAKPVTIQIQ